MLVQFNSDKNIEGTEALARQSEATIRDALEHYSAQITRIEIHVSDENSSKKAGTDANRCRIEARLRGRQPIAVSHSASSVAQSVDGAADRLKRKVEGVLGRRDAGERTAPKSQLDATADIEAPLPDAEVTLPPSAQADGTA